MEKQLAWIMIRTLGVYFSAQVIAYTFYLCITVFTLLKLYSPSIRSLSMENETDMLVVNTWVRTGSESIQLVLYVLLAYYFLRKGLFVHKLLMYRSTIYSTGPS